MKLTAKQKGKLLVAWGKTVAKLTPLIPKIIATSDYSRADDKMDLYVAKFLYAASGIIPLTVRDGLGLIIKVERDSTTAPKYVTLTCESGSRHLRFYFNDPLKIEEH